MSITPIAWVIPLFFAAFAYGTESVTEREFTEKLHFYQSIKSLHSRFKQTKRMKEMGVELTAEGTLTLTPPNALLWEITRPSRLVVHYDGKKMRIESGTGKDVTVQTFGTTALDPGNSNAHGLNTLLAWLRFDAQYLYKQYRITKVNERIYRFEPLHTEGAPFRNITMTLNPAGHVEHLEMEEVSQDTLKIDFATPRVLRGR